MSEENTPKSGIAPQLGAKKKPGPKKKSVAKKKAAKKAAAPAISGLGTTKSMPKPTPKLKKFIPMHERAVSNLPPEANDPNYFFKWCTDYGQNKLKDYENAGYEYVRNEDGSMKIRPGGNPLYLMKQPMELRKANNLAKSQKIIDTNMQIQRDAAVQAGDVPEYIPKGQEAVIQKDHLS